MFDPNNKESEETNKPQEQDDNQSFRRSTNKLVTRLVVDRRPHKEMIGDFASSTTMHGVSFIHEAATRGLYCTLLTWVVIFCVAVYFCTVNVVSRIDYYNSGPTVTRVKVFNQMSMPLPQVTLCNMSPFHLSNFFTKIISFDTAMYQTLRQANLQPYSEYTFAPREGDSGEEDKSEDVWFVSYDTFAPAFSDLELAAVSEIGFAIDDMLISCEIGSTSCNSSHFSTNFTKIDFGNCFTFTPPRTQVRPGPRGGIRLMLNPLLDQNVHSDMFDSEGKGIRLVLHGEGDIPELESGIILNPGTTNDVRISRTEVYDVSSSATNCSRPTPGYRYSQQHCLDECIEDEMYNLCDCKPREYYRCNATASRCARDTRSKQYLEITEFCGRKGCFPPCSSTIFDATLSNSPFPELGYQVQYVNNMLELGLCRVEVNQTEADFVDDCWEQLEGAIQVNIFYSSMAYDEFTKEDAYTIEELLSELGGSAGLFIGASFITVAEFIQFLYRMILSRFYQANKARRKSFRSNSADPQRTETLNAASL